MFTSIGPAVNALNELFDLDPSALHCLQAHRVPCNRALADHPTVQVMTNDMIPVTKSHPENIIMGVMGLINGAMTAATGEVIATQWSHRRDKEGSWYFDGFRVFTPEDREHNIPKVPVPEDPWAAAFAALQAAVHADYDAVRCATLAKCPRSSDWNHRLVPKGWTIVNGLDLLNATLLASFGRRVSLSDHDRQFVDHEGA